MLRIVQQLLGCCHPLTYHSSFVRPGSSLRLARVAGSIRPCMRTHRCHLIHPFAARLGTMRTDEGGENTNNSEALDVGSDVPCFEPRHRRTISAHDSPASFDSLSHSHQQTLPTVLMCRQSKFVHPWRSNADVCAVASGVALQIGMAQAGFCPRSQASAPTLCKPPGPSRNRDATESSEIGFSCHFGDTLFPFLANSSQCQETRSNGVRPPPGDQNLHSRGATSCLRRSSSKVRRAAFGTESDAHQRICLCLCEGVIPFAPSTSCISECCTDCILSVALGAGLIERHFASQEMRRIDEGARARARSRPHTSHFAW